MSTPAHVQEHDDLMMLIAKIVNKSELIKHTILITVGNDDRPCVGGDIPPLGITHILRQLVEAEDQIEGVDEIEVPRDN